MQYAIYFNGIEECHGGVEISLLSPDLASARRYINKHVLPASERADGEFGAWKGSVYALPEEQTIPDLTQPLYSKSL